MLHRTLVIVLLVQLAVVVAVTVIVLALRRWQRTIWLREQGQTAGEGKGDREGKGDITCSDENLLHRGD